jgi:hypothetical protein
LGDFALKSRNSFCPRGRWARVNRGKKWERRRMWNRQNFPKL